MLKMKRLGLAVVAAALVGAVPALAQDAPEGVIASGLNNPRNILIFGETPSVYIVEAGAGGDEQVNGNFGPAQRGLTSGFTAITSSGDAVVVSGFPSLDEGGEVSGLSGIALINNQVWVSGRDGTTSSFVFALDPASGEVISQIDVLAAETQFNPDGGVIDSNPVDLSWDPNNSILYIADAGANTVWKWTEATGLEIFTSWPESENPVPTSVAATPDGSVYVGFLTGFPFPEAGARVDHLGANGELIESFDGFTAVVDLLFANGTLYAVQLGSFDEGWQPGTGSVVDVFSGEVYAQNLNFPYGLAGGGAAPLMVALNSAYVGAGTGGVVDLSSAEAFSAAAMEAADG
ncbi:MAG: ScyD/ScyE family protein [Anaerolineae bacterium]|nr:ScyD/ScyE family protein [Anaerolineae bacterium]